MERGNSRPNRPGSVLHLMRRQKCGETAGLAVTWAIHPVPHGPALDGSTDSELTPAVTGVRETRSFEAYEELSSDLESAAGVSS
jgi:hypothetical protein